VLHPFKSLQVTLSCCLKLCEGPFCVSSTFPAQRYSNARRNELAHASSNIEYPTRCSSQTSAILLTIAAVCSHFLICLQS
jgi:hypothetical protein